jgi:hypothetical protein
LESNPNCTMSDEEEITRKIPGGSKIIEKVKKSVEDDCEPDGKQVVRVVKKRKIDEIPAKYKYRSYLEHPRLLMYSQINSSSSPSYAAGERGRNTSS